MRIEELRINNKVQDNNGFVFDIVAIFKDGTIYCDFEGNEGDVWEFDDNNPYLGIQLTEEILLKCGFEKVNKLFYDDNTYINLYQFESCYISLDNYTNVFFDWIDKSVMCYETMYLHQLQNLYFALTNQELNIEL